MHDKQALLPLKQFLLKVPGINERIGTGFFEDGRWWVKLTIDIENPLAWSVIQELAHVLNYMSINDRLPTVFMPVSPPPYLNGGPHDFLSWIIESKDKNFEPEKCAEWLEGRLRLLRIDGQ